MNRKTGTTMNQKMTTKSENIELVRGPFTHTMVERNKAPKGWCWVRPLYSSHFVLTNAYDETKPSVVHVGQKGVPEPKRIKLKLLGLTYQCDFAAENTEAYGDWVILKRPGSKPIDLYGDRARPIIEMIKKDRR